MSDDAAGRSEELRRPPSGSVAGSGRDAEVIRSEEVLDVSLATEATERVVLRKRVVTEEVTQVVERRREELVVERYPIDPENGTGLGPNDMPTGEPFLDADYEIVLYEERVVVTKEVVPVERVHVDRHTVTDTMEVRDTLRREHVDLVPDSAVVGSPPGPEPDNATPPHTAPSPEVR